MTRPAHGSKQRPAGVPAGLTQFNLIAASVLMAASVFALVYLIPVHVPLRAGLDQGLSARFMPSLAAWFGLALSGLLLLEIGHRYLRGRGPMSEDNEDNERQGFARREIGETFMLSAGAAAYMVLLYLFGFLPATSVALLVCMWAGRFRNFAWLAVLCLALPYLLQKALWHGLYVILPGGII